MNIDNLVIYENISQLLTLEGVVKKEGRNVKKEDLGVLENASVIADPETSLIVWVGKTSDTPKEYSKVVNRFSSVGEIWLPELVECHTHLVYAGTRTRDFGLRCEGKSYLQVAEEGGGILSTIKDTRKASGAELEESAIHSVDLFQKYGIGTIEIKSGYGLSLESELKILNVIRNLSEKTSVHLIPTFLPAHATPPEFKGRTEEYVDIICTEWIPEVAKEGLALFFDVFVEEGYFSVAQTKKLCEKALEAGLKLKLHADQFNALGGTELGVDLGAASIDHLDNASDSAIKKLAHSQTVAVLCPGASLFTGNPYPPARKILDAGGIVALSTDFNPGTSPTRNLPLMTTLACSQMKMTVAEAIASVTYNAAKALCLEDEVGALLPGRPFRACQLHAESFEVLPYCFGELV